MACIDIAGITWQPDRLLFDDSADAVEEVRLDLDVPDADGNFTGRFRARNGTPIPDQLLHGKCRLDGLRHFIEFTREHDGEPRTTTSYRGRVTIVRPTGDVLIRGTFVRTITSSTNVETTTKGDYETEKPT